MKNNYRPRLRFVNHAVERMKERGITREDIHLAVTYGDFVYSRRDRIIYDLSPGLLPNAQRSEVPLQARWGPWRRFCGLRVVVEPKKRKVITAFPCKYREREDT